MKASELRIGNLVYELYGQTKEICTFDFSLYESHDINGKTYFDEDFGFDVFQQLEPIPLTEEWLFRMGFRKRDNFGITWFIEELTISQDQSDNFYYGSTLKIQHVHQVQNLYFSLTGEELTIDG